MIILKPVSSLVFFISLGIDIAMFFLLVRLALNWREISWLASIDRAGSPITEVIIEITKIIFNKSFSEIGSVVIGLWLLSLVKMIVILAL